MGKLSRVTIWDCGENCGVFCLPKPVDTAARRSLTRTLVCILAELGSETCPLQRKTCKKTERFASDTNYTALSSDLCIMYMKRRD